MIHHGMSKAGVFKSWHAMLRRCYNPKDIGFYKYGAVGIRVCEFIRATPANLVLLIGHRPLATTLDRLKGEFGYTCGQCAECLAKDHKLNVRWATHMEQNHNRKGLRYVEFNGETKCVAEWARISSLSEATLRQRLRLGWTGDKLFAPVGTVEKKLKSDARLISFGSKTLHLAEWARLSGVAISTIRNRLIRGWSIDRVLQNANAVSCGCGRRI